MEVYACALKSLSTCPGESETTRSSDDAFRLAWQCIPLQRHLLAFAASWGRPAVPISTPFVLRRILIAVLTMARAR